MTPNPTQANVFAAIGNFLTAVLPPGTGVYKSQVNRVPEPVGSDFVMMTPLSQTRLETNVDTYTDTVFTASIAGTVMTVSSVASGTIAIGAQVFGTGLVSGSLTITAFISGSGGPGTYSISNSQTVSSQLMAAGLKALLQPTEWRIQLDVHGPNSADNAVVISTAYRDEFGVNNFISSGFDVAPLYADDPRQMVFENDASQMEDRWIVEACLQCNSYISVSQQFASILALNLVEVI